MTDNKIQSIELTKHSSLEFAYLYDSFEKVILDEGIISLDYGSFEDGDIYNIYIPKSLKYYKDAFQTFNYIGNIYYAGSEDEWNALINENGEYPFNKAKEITFNYKY